MNGTIIQPKNTDDYYLQSLIMAIKEIPDQFIKSGICEYMPPSDICEESLENEIKYKKIHLVERVFAYELYRRWQNALWGNEDDLLVSGEIQKKLINDIYNNAYSFEKNTKNRTIFYPDLVLHHKDFEESKCNMIACEIKRACNSYHMDKDFNSLVEYTNPSTKRESPFSDFHPYHMGVFVLYGMKNSSNSNDIPSFEKIKPYAKKVPERFWNNIHCIIYNGEDLEHKTVEDLCNSKV